MAANPQARRIDLTQLQPQQIIEIRQSTEQEIGHFNQSLQALQAAQGKLKDCIVSIEEMLTAKESDILIPMTSSLYLPGKVENKDEYLVDIGTGYFVNKLTPEAKSVYEKKINKLEEDAKKLKEILIQKNEILNTINLVLRKKVMESEANREQ